MNFQPFSYSPDTFYLQLQGSVESFSVRAYESPWGSTDEKLCYFEGVLIGLLLIKKLPQDDPQTFFIKLLPGLDRQRAYEWPDVHSFGIAISALLSRTRSWELRCERDTDQSPVPLIVNHKMLLEKFANALSFCMGTNPTCPNFIGRGSTFQPNNKFQPTPSARLN